VKKGDADPDKIGLEVSMLSHAMVHRYRGTLRGMATRSEGEPVEEEEADAT
jgi:hypothetical protein